MKARNQPSCPRREGESGAAIVLAILVLAILTVVGIALLLLTGTESRIAASEWSVNRAFYASDAGIRWGTVEMTDYVDFLSRPEFTGSAFGTVLFQLPSHRIVYGVPGAVFSGAEDIAVTLQTPSVIGRRFAPGGRINAGSGFFYYSYEMRSASSDQAFGQYAKALVAQVDVGPLPETAGSQ